MGQNKNAIIGFIGIGIIIMTIVGVVVVLLPEESTEQNIDVVKGGEIEFNPIIVEQTEKVFPSYQDSFRLILEQCYASDSYTDYFVFEESIPSIQSGIPFEIEDMKKGLTLSEELGYNNHPTIGPMITEVRMLEEEINGCITDLQNKYEKNLEIIENVELKMNTEEEILEFVKNYKGKDNTGLTLFDTLAKLINVAYPGEDILSSPTTTGYFIASHDYDKEISDRYWKVEMKMQTYKETAYFEWVVDTDTNLIYPVDERSKSVLDMVDNFD